MKQQKRRIVITGVTRGLGRALTEAFLRQGHWVAGFGRTTETIAQLQVWAASQEGHAWFDVVNVAVETEVAAWSRRVIAEWGPPDLLINNAAVMPTPAVLWEVPAKDFDYTLAVNLSGVANVIRYFVPAMIHRRQGIIANISSGWGRAVAPKVAPYCATKWAIEGLTKALALELPPGMAAVAVNPGIIATDMLRLCFGSEADNYPNPQEWAVQAAPFFLRLGPSENGLSLTV